MKSDEISEFGLIIIQSLPESEPQTGTDLHSSIIKYKKFKEPNLRSDLYDVNSAQDFFVLLEMLYNRAVNDKYFFVLHLEMHGYDDGIRMKNGDKISWKNILPYFRKINVEFCNYLAVYLAVCKSANLLQYIDPLDRAPFRAIVTTPKDILLRDLIPGFEAFYDHFFFELDAQESIEKYNAAISPDGSKMYLITAKYSFDTITDIERKTADTKSILEIIKSSLLSKQPHLKYTPIVLHMLAEKEMKNTFDELKKNKSYFLMKDLDEDIPM